MAKPQVHEFHVEMTCEGCCGAVQRVLDKMKGNGIEKVDISLPEQKVKVTATLTADEVLQVIKKTGKTCKHICST